MKKTFAIETSCDDTSIAIVSYDRDVFFVEKMLSYSQIQSHLTFGGVVPEIAYRLHQEKIIPLFQEIGYENIRQCDSISVTIGPGLPGSLLVGTSSANFLSRYFGLPLNNIFHIDGHIFSFLLERKISDAPFPWIVLTASGGHNDLYLIDTKLHHNFLDQHRVVGKFFVMKIGQTLDDAAGECFDKVSRMLGGPYPGGKWIGDQAKMGSVNNLIHFKKIMLSDRPWDFSFSGMKSQMYYLLSRFQNEGVELNNNLVSDICFAFQETMCAILSQKLINAGIYFGARTLAVCGGVSANDRLIDIIDEQLSLQYSHPVNFFVPMKKTYSTDNAAMIGLIGLIVSEK